MAAIAAAGDPGSMNRMRKIAVWAVIVVLVFMLVATLVLDGA
jgi:hypothetical protein